jgi:hypothetical protein
MEDAWLQFPLHNLFHRLWEFIFKLRLSAQQRQYCRVSIKSTPLHDCDMPDEILVSSPCLEGCDKRKISSGVAAFRAIPSIFIAKLVAAVSHQGKNYILMGYKSQKYHIWSSVTFRPFVRTSPWPVTLCKNANSSKSQPQSGTRRNFGILVKCTFQLTFFQLSIDFQLIFSWPSADCSVTILTNKREKEAHLMLVTSGNLTKLLTID